MMDVASALRKVSALRSLCLRLPHLPTETEQELLRRFDALVTVPHVATKADVDALAAGWRRWWRLGDLGVLGAMASRLSAGYVDNDRRLAGLSRAATLAQWNAVQQGIWKCTSCSAHPLVELNVTQQTDAPLRACKLAVVSLAPPYLRASHKTEAKSATNTPDDALRLFLERVLDLRWPDLTARGLVLLHAVKCAIRPNDRGVQNPPSPVVDACAPQHLAREINLLKPRIVVTLGRMAYRAIVKGFATGTDRDATLRLSTWPSESPLGRERLRDHCFW